MYSRKTGIEGKYPDLDHVVNIEFILTDGEPINQKDLEILEHSAKGIQMTAKIVDQPCNEMHTDAFLDVSFWSSNIFNSTTKKSFLPHH